MALPKRRHTQARGRKRRTHYKLEPIGHIEECPQCGQPKERHRMCAKCGFYNKREVVQKLA